MAWQNKNFAYSTLNGGVLIGDLSLVVTTGANFPATGNFMLVIWDQAYANPSFDATRELVLCTARTADTITITRAQEGTSAKAWNSGDKVASVYTAAMLDTVVLLTEVQTLTNKTLTTPTIASMVNANHDHSAGAGGGVLPVSSIGSGTLVHERGGLEADVSAYSGLVKITGGVTSAVAAPTSTIVGISDSQSLSNKTLVSATISGTLHTTAWTDWSATAVATGWSTVSTKWVHYKKVGRLIFAKIYVTGTSNSASTSLTLPYASTADGTGFIFFGRGQDNAVDLTTPILGSVASSAISFFTNAAGAAWTASGTKMVMMSIWYEATS